MPAPAGERVGELEVAALSGLPVQLDERHLDHGMPVGPRLGPAAELLVHEVGEAAGDRQQPLVARRPRECDGGLGEVPEAVELVAHLQVAPAPGGILDLAPRVQVAVGHLRGGDELDRLGREPLELGRGLASELPGEGLEPLVDVGVAEDHPAAFAGRPPCGDAEVLERAVPLELLGAAQEGHVVVDALAVAEKPAGHADVGGVDRPELQARFSGWHDAPDHVPRNRHRSAPLPVHDRSASRSASRIYHTCRAAATPSP